MVSIKRFDEYGNIEVIECDDLLLYMKANVGDFKRGYRLYEDGKDITENPQALQSAKDLVMQNPYKDPGTLDLLAIAIISFVVSAGVAYYMASRIGDMTPPDSASRTQGSATNSFGQRTNEPAVGKRIDDIWGIVNNHTPRLMSVPLREFVDNKEVEKFAVYVSQGKVDIPNVRDGSTNFSRLTGAKFNAWWPDSNPNHPTNTAPVDEFTIGGLINEPIYIVKESEELEATELLPPNDLEISGNPNWLVTSNGTTATITLSNQPDIDVDLRDHFTIGEDASLIDCTVITSTIITQLWKSVGASGSESADFTIITGTEPISGLYEVTDVTEGSFTVDVFGAGWGSYTDKPLLRRSWTFATQTQPAVVRTTTNSSINDFTWYDDSELTDQVINISAFENFPSVGQVLNNTTPPIFVDAEDDIMQFNFVSDQGFYKIVEGNEKSINANVEIIYQYLDSDGNVSNTLFDQVPYSTNSKSKTKQAAITYISSRSTGDYGVLVSCRRTTDRDKSSNVSNVDKITWRDFYTKTNMPDQDYGNITMAQIELPFSQVAKSVKERRLNMNVGRYITPYIGNGSFGAEEVNNNVAETSIALALDSLNGRLSLKDIDADLLLSVQQQLIDYYGNPDFVKVGYDFDSTSMRFQEQFHLLWNAVTCKAYGQGAKYKAYPDIRRDESSKQFTHRNKIVGTDTRKRTYRVQNDGVEVSYRSNETGEFETIILHVNGQSSNNRIEMELSGAISEIQAQVRAHRELNMLKYQKVSFSFEGDGVARLTVPSERIDNVDLTRVVSRPDNENVYDIYAGFVTQTFLDSESNLVAELSDPVYFTEGETHSIRFTDTEGELLESITCTEGDTEYHVVLAQSPSKDIYTGYEMEKTNFTFAADNSRLALPMLVVDTEASERDNIQTRILSGINYDARYYQNDQDWSL